MAKGSLSFAWITGFTVVSLAANFISLFGCISPGAKDFALYRVNVTLLAEGLVKQTHSKPRLDAADLGDPSLPTWWYWGMNGICDVNTVTKETRCHRAFPASKTILTIVEDSLRDDLSSEDPLPTNRTAVLSAWNTTLNELPPYILATDEARFVAQVKASAALVISAIVIDFFCPFIALLTETSKYVAPTISALIAIAAGTLAVLAMNNGPHGAISTGEHGGVGIIILFVGAALRLGSSAFGSGVSWFGGSNNNRPPPPTLPVYQLPEYQQPQYQQPQYQQPQYQRPQYQRPQVQQPETLTNKEVGYRGESHMHNWLAREIPDWSHENWTSGLRAEHNEYPPFNQNEKDFTDFTYRDRSGAMVRFLRKAGAPVLDYWSTATTFHLEVKTTPGGWDVPFFVSKYQIEKMQNYNHDPRNAYILVRVVNIGGARSVRFFENPWSMRTNGGSGELEFREQNAQGAYPVYIRL